MALATDLKEFGFQVFHAEGPAAAEARMDKLSHLSALVVDASGAPEADRALILRAAQEVTPFMRKLIKDNDETLLAEMETKNAKVNRKPDIAAFRRSVEPVYEKAREKYGADAKAVLEEAAAIRAQAK